jgi:hypothetical protein
MSNDELVAAVSEELFWDPKLDSEAIAVSSVEGIVTLAERSEASARSARQRRPPSACTVSPL